MLLDFLIWQNSLRAENGQSTVNSAGAGTLSEGAQWLDSDWEIFGEPCLLVRVGRT